MLEGEATRCEESTTVEPATLLDRWTAPVMFAAAVTWVLAAGIVIHLTGSIELAGQPVLAGCQLALLVLTPLFWVEVIIQWWAGGRISKLHLLAAVFPPLRLGVRDHSQNTRIWLPVTGWRAATPELAEQLERAVSLPMIGVALLILPLLAVEHIYAERMAQQGGFALTVQLAAVLIWLAFVVEYLVMLSLVDKRWTFVRKHWLDLAIICLPLISFLRSMRLLRMLKLQQLGKTARVFRLRGLAMRAWRAVVVLELVDRLLHRDPQARLDVLQARLIERQQEIEALQAEIARCQARLGLSETLRGTDEGISSEVPVA